MVIIVIDRAKLYPTPGRNYRVAWKWTYRYAIDDAPPLEYGTGLTDLCSVLKRKYPSAQIQKSWEGK